MLFIIFILALYAFARKVVINEPLKTHLDSCFEFVNKKLYVYTGTEPQIVMQTLAKVSLRTAKYSFISLVLIMILFSDKIEGILFRLILPVLVTSFFLNLSINWIQNHKKTFKEHFLNIRAFCFLFSPSLIYFVGHVFAIEEFNKFFDYIPWGNIKFNIVYFQVIWFAMIFIITYLGALLIALPIYIFLYTIIISFAVFIKIVSSYNRHLLDGIAGLATLIVAFYKFVM